MIPTWLKKQLELAGRLDTDGVSRTITAGTCRHCRTQIVRGLDADMAGIPVTADPTPIDQLGEALALMSGRGTYDLTHTAGRWQISHRDQWRIGANRRPGPAVLAEHHCGAPPLPAAPLPEPATRPTFTEEPCF